MAISKVTTSNTNTINKVTVTDGDAISIITVGTQGLAGAATLLGVSVEAETVGSSDAGSTIIYDHANLRWLATTSSNATSLTTKLAGLVFTAGGATVTGVLDEDNLGSDSNTKLATQQSIKAYVDAQITAQDFDFQGDTGGALSIDLDSETMTFTGGTGIDTSGSGNTVTFAIDSTVATLSGSQTLSNKTLTAPVLNTVDINGGDISSGTTINKSPSITLAGDLSGSVTLSNLADGTLTATIVANSVALGTDTTGDYVSSLVAGTGVTLSNNSGETATPTIAIGQSVGTTDDVTFNSVTADVTGDLTGNVIGATEFTAKAGEDLTKGDAVYISGISGNTPVVNKADADDASKMPSFGLVETTVSANASVGIITFGTLSGLDTSSFSAGDILYISTTAGGLTATQPSGESSQVQNIGIVQRAHASAGSIKVGGAGRTNATPNLNDGKIFIGNASNQVTTSTLDTSLVPENTNLYHTTERVQDVVGGMVTGNTENGIAVTYDDTSGILNFDVADPTVTLSGDVAGSGTITNLGDVTITTTIQANSVALGTDTTGNYIATVAAGEGIDVSGSGSESAAITISAELATETNAGVATFDGTDFTVTSGDVTVNAERIQDIVGAMVESNTESGITVTYQDTDGTLDFDVDDFTITLSGDVAGSGTVTDLGNVSITTTVQANSVALGTDTTGNYIATIADAGNSRITVANSGAESAAVTLDITDNAIGANQIADNSIALGTKTTGNYVATITGTANEIEISGSGSETAAVTIGLPDDVTIGNDLTVTGDLTVNGDTVTLNTATLDVEDATIRVAKGATSLANTNGAGIEFGASTSKPTITWDNSNSRLSSNKVFAATSFVGDVAGNATTATALATARTIALSGDVAATGVSFDGSGNITLTTTIQANSVALGTDTTGNYLATLAASNSGIDVANSGSESAAVTVGLNTEYTQDLIGAMFTGNTETGITATYQDADGTIDLEIGSGDITNDMLAGSIANAKLANSTITVTDGSTSTATSLGGTITFSAGEGLDVGESSGTITFSAEDATASNKGIASFDSTDFTVSSGAVTVNAERIQDIMGAMFGSNTETGITATYQDADGTIDLVIGSGDITNDMLAGSIANAKLANSTITVTDGSTSTATALGGTITFSAGEGIDVGESSGTITVSGEDATSSNKGIASFTGDFSVSSGAVSLATSGVSAATYGSATAIPVIAVDAKGRITSASTASISTSFTVTDGSTNQTVSGGDTLTFAGTANEVEVAVSATDTVTIGLPSAVTLTTLNTTNLNIGSAAITEAELEILDGATVTTTELNIIDGDTSATSTTLADADRVVVNDAGTMKQVALTDFETYFESALDTLSNVTSVGTLSSLTVSGATALNGGLTMDTNKFVVADTTGNTTIGGTLDVTGATGLTGDLTVDTNVLKVDTSNNRVGIKQASPSVTLDIGSATDAMLIPVGTTAQRPSGAAGQFRYNSTLGRFEGYTDDWGEIGGAGASTFNVNTFTANGSTTAFTLSQTPASEDNILVFVEGVFMNANDFTLSGTTLTLDAAPPNGRKITVYHVTAAVAGTGLTQDSFTGNGSTTAYTLSVAPVSENNTQVYIDGVYQNKATYSTSGTTLTFDAAPANSAAIEAITFTQTNINNFPASGISDLTQVTPVAGDFMMILDATDSALKKSDVKDVMRTAVAIDSSADAVALTFDADENATFAANVEVTGDIIGQDDLFLDSDAAVIHLGEDGDVTLTHVADTGVLINSTRQLQFGDSGTYIHQSADGVLDLVADTEIEINATTIDVNGALDVSGNITGTLATAAQTNITSLGTLTALTVDDITINGSTISDSGDLTIDTEADLTLTALSDIIHQTTSTNSTAGHHIFKSYNTEIMRIDGGSNTVGIGNNDPDYLLDMRGAIGDQAPLQRWTATGTPSDGFNWVTEAMSANLGQDKRIVHAFGKERSNGNSGTMSFVPRASSGDNAIAFGIFGNNDILNITYNGNVGIGTTSPTNTLDLGVATQGRALTFTNYSNLFSEYSNASFWLASNFYGNAGASGYKTGATGNFGAAGIRVHATGGGGNSGIIQFYTDTNASKTANAAYTPSEKMRLNENGKLTVGSTPSQNNGVIEANYTGNAFTLWLTATGQNYLGFESTESGGQAWSFRTAGTASYGSANGDLFFVNGSGTTFMSMDQSAGTVNGDFNDTSDIGLKKNVKDTTDGLDALLKLKARKFDWKDENKRNNVNGFIAQEVETVLPNEVIGDDYNEEKPEHGNKSINTSGLLAVAVKAIQEQQTLIDDLKARIEKLES